MTAGTAPRGGDAALYEQYAREAMENAVRDVGMLQAIANVVRRAIAEDRARRPVA